MNILKAKNQSLQKFIFISDEHVISQKSKFAEVHIYIRLALLKYENQSLQQFIFISDEHVKSQKSKFAEVQIYIRLR